MASKKYSLKPLETQLLATTHQQFQVLVSNLLSSIALERLAYTVTEKTQFSVSPDFTSVSISEKEDAPEVVTGKSAKDVIKEKE